MFHIDRLADAGPLLDEPHTRQVDGKLRELRCYLEGRPVRVTYWIARARRIILLTVFAKTRPRERAELVVGVGEHLSENRSIAKLVREGRAVIRRAS